MRGRRQPFGVDFDPPARRVRRDLPRAPLSVATLTMPMKRLETVSRGVIFMLRFACPSARVRRMLAREVPAAVFLVAVQFISWVMIT